MKAHSNAEVVPAIPLPDVEGVSHHFALIGGFRMHYAEAGSGPPLVLLHGWPQHWWSWRFLIGPLATKYRVICPDLRGMGWSEGSDASGYTLRRMAMDIVELMDHLGIRQAKIVGHDWGSVIGYQISLTWAERVERFVPLGGPHIWANEGGPARLWLRPWHVYLIAALGDLASTRMGITTRCLRAWRHRGRFTAAELRTYLDPMSTSRSRLATRAYDRNLVLREIPYFLRVNRKLRLRVPTLHLNGDRDPLTRGVPESYRQHADDIRLELIPSCGHFIAEEQPGLLIERLLEFFSDIEAGAPRGDATVTAGVTDRNAAPTTPSTTRGPSDIDRRRDHDHQSGSRDRAGSTPIASPPC